MEKLDTSNNLQRRSRGDWLPEYKKQGFAYGIPLLSKSEATNLVDEMHAFETESHRSATTTIRRKGHLLWLPFYNLVFNPQILDLVESVIGENILCWGVGLFHKPAGSRSYVAWHQDNAYLKLEPPNKAITIWIALTDCDIHNGCMQMLPHSQNRLRDHVAVNKATDNQIRVSLPKNSKYLNQKPVNIELEAGHCSFHHPNTIHRSGPNRSEIPRTGFAIRYLSPDVRQHCNGTHATLVRGRDRFRSYTADPIPTGNLDQKIVKFCDEYNA